jgi:hypothetical protein
MPTTGARSSPKHRFDIRQGALFAGLATAATTLCFGWLRLVGSMRLASRIAPPLLLVSGVIAIYFALGAIFARLRSRSTTECLGLGVAVALGSFLQALILSIQWGARGPAAVFVGLALAILIAWAGTGTFYRLIGNDDGFMPFLAAGTANASLLLVARIVTTILDDTAATVVMSAIAVAMFVAPAAWIGALLPPAQSS